VAICLDLFSVFVLYTTNGICERVLKRSTLDVVLICAFFSYLHIVLVLLREQPHYTSCDKYVACGSI
jgi:hypothetical protein